MPMRSLSNTLNNIVATVTTPHKSSRSKPACEADRIHDKRVQSLVETAAKRVSERAALRSG
jgi:hypothetical protein